MNPRPIDGNALYDIIQDNACHDVMSVADVLSFIENAPTLDYAPVRHGEWIEGLKCSECGNVDWTKPNYCSTCGAKTKEDEKDEKL